MSSRSHYLQMSPSEVQATNDKTWNQLEINGKLARNLVDTTDIDEIVAGLESKNYGVKQSTLEEIAADIVASLPPLPRFKLTYNVAVQRLGLKYVKEDVTFRKDANGNLELDKDGKPIKESGTMPAFDWQCKVKVAGFQDAFGNDIPVGNAYFVNTRQASNRGFTQSNAESMVPRLAHFMLNGEALIKDEGLCGQNEQHRCGAMVMDSLTGANCAPPDGIDTLTIGGIVHEACGSIDTGRKKSAADELSSNEELFAPDMPLSYQDSLHLLDPEHKPTGHGSAARIFRKSLFAELSSVSRQTALRMIGRNIKASVFDSNESILVGDIVATRWIGLDKLVNIATVMVDVIPQKTGPTGAKVQTRPCTAIEVATAYALYSLRNSERALLVDKKPLESAMGLADYHFPAIDYQPLINFCSDLRAASMEGTENALLEWANHRCLPERKKDSTEFSFSQVLVAMVKYFNGETISKTINLKDGISRTPESGSNWYHVGGGDRGPIPKAVKE